METNIEVKDNNYLTPLHIASSLGYTDVIKYLVSKGANKNAKHKEGETPYDVHANDDKSQKDIIRIIN